MIDLATLLLLFHWVGNDSGSVYAKCTPPGNVEIFSKPNGESSVGKIPCGTALVILAGGDQWDIVKTPDGTVGYINRQSITLDKSTSPARTNEANNRNNSPTPPQVTIDQQGSTASLSHVLNVPSNGTGYGSGVGESCCVGITTGDQRALGPNNASKGTGSGGGVFEVGGNVSPPRIKYETQPEYTDEARNAKHEGTVVVRATVGADGRIHDPHVIRSLGLGLDAKAIEAVSQWLFEPATKDGKKVAVFVDIEVNFRCCTNGTTNLQPRREPTARRRPLSNSDVISMVNSGLSSPVILAKINSSDCDFDTSPEGLRNLKAAHVPDDLVVEMIKRH